MRLLDLLAIIALAILWYALVPIGGAFLERRRWRLFRRRFDDLRLEPVLDYSLNAAGLEGLRRFYGRVESLGEDQILWLRGEDLSIPVSLAGAKTYALFTQENSPDPFSPTAPGGARRIKDLFNPGKETPIRIKWREISALSGESRVFVGGSLIKRDNRLSFVSTRERPLLVIFYTGQDRLLTPRVIQTGRTWNEYWNVITPYALILGAFSLVMFGYAYIRRPLYRLTVISSLAAALIPLFPLAPPGFLLTLVYRQLWQRARILRIYRDLAALPLKRPPLSGNLLPDGERYGCIRVSPERVGEIADQIPLLIPEKEGIPCEGWHCFGALDEDPPDDLSGAQPDARAIVLPREPLDPGATFGAAPGDPEHLARKFTAKAYVMEAVSWVFLLGGIGLNIFFLGLILLYLV